ncbi:MAG: LpxI family protein [Candidatus Omnitrophica bacterium]|nr:LpxI family protein [Candidatus Omnitrophota bacterium]
MPNLGLIAGGGDFPLTVARCAKERGWAVYAVGLADAASPQLTDVADQITWLSVGQVGELCRFFKSHHVSQAILAGKITKEVLLRGASAFDADALAILAAAPDRSVDGLLGALAARLAREGTAVIDSTTFLKEWLPSAGVLTRRPPTQEEWEDIRFGRTLARTLAGCDAGQTVVVKRRVVLAVEALEGTDAAIRRAGTLGGEGAVVVKMARPQQDWRFDVPVVGLRTLEALIAGRAACLAVEAGRTLLLEQPTLVARADALGLVIVAVEPEGRDAS